MKVLHPADYRVMPWKNGGGATTELYVFPADSMPSGPPFRWRVSIAEVNRDGPFSQFQGYDRQIMTVTGNGLMLEGGPQGPIDVTARFEPRCFSGDWSIFGRLVDGPVRDFNMITRRAGCTGRLRAEFLDAPMSFQAGPAMIFIHILAGDFGSEAGALEMGSSVLLDPQESLTLILAAISGRLAVCEIYSS